MKLFKDGIAKTIPDNKAEEYKAAGWVEVGVAEKKQAAPKQPRGKKEA